MESSSKRLKEARPRPGEKRKSRKGRKKMDSPKLKSLSTEDVNCDIHTIYASPDADYSQLLFMAGLEVVLI